MEKEKIQIKEDERENLKKILFTFWKSYSMLNLENREMCLEVNVDKIVEYLDTLIQAQRESLVEEEIMKFMREIQERANTIPPNLLLNEVVNYAYDRVKEIKENNIK